MVFVDNCILCNSKNLDSYSAITSSFIADRIWSTKPFKIKFLKCKDCGIHFYNLRFDNKEASRLYDGYRDEKYQSLRLKHEKWYTKELNKLIENNPIENKNRKGNLSEIVNKFIRPADIKNVLDFGGDQGQRIIDEFSHANRFVYDISGTNPLPGIYKIKNISESKQKKFDFIMCCHVLEHVTFPIEIINQIKMFSHQNTIFYFEIPNDSPLSIIKKKNLAIDTIKKILFSYPNIFSFFYNIMYQIGKPLNVFQMHEHINHFSIESSKKMLSSQGFEIIYIGTKIIDLLWTKGEIISCLAKLK
jgi:hypothetical protein